jgi:hypothetical protein
VKDVCDFAPLNWAATGGMIFPAIAQSLLPRIGFWWTVRTIGFVVIFSRVMILLLVRPRIPSRKTGPLVDWGAFKDIEYLVFTLGTFLTHFM